MTDQIILACDEKGNFLEYIPKEIGHTGKGKRHLAITVLIYNSKGQVLLQRRKHKVFNNIWDITGATHPLHKEDGKDETFEEATWRCLEREYRIKKKIPLENLGSFNYFADYGDLCENENCAILIGEYKGDFDLNSEVGYGYKWMDKKEFLEDIENNPKNYSPWAAAMLQLIKNSNLFNC